MALDMGDLRMSSQSTVSDDFFEETVETGDEEVLVEEKPDLLFFKQ